MNLQEHIRRILREESETLKSLSQLRRRTYIIDDAFNNNLNHFSKKDFSSKETLLKKVIDHTLRDLHGDYFVYSELSDEEWNKFRKFIVEYIKSNYNL